MEGSIGGNDGRFDDGRLDELVAAINDARLRVAFFDALFLELVEGARAARDDLERDGYATQALVVAGALTVSRNALALDELARRIEELATAFGASIDKLARVMREHDKRAQVAIENGAVRVDALAAEVHTHDDWARAEAQAGHEWRQRGDR